MVAAPRRAIASPAPAAESAVSWNAIIGGALASVTISLILIALASGLGLTLVTPWDSAAVVAGTVTAATGIALVVVQWIAAALGGYITGRLRADWDGAHAHEVFFRDTAHGFLTWALATVAGLAMAGLLATTVISGGVHAAATGGSAIASAAPYELDLLFRGGATEGSWRGEAARILGHAAADDVSPADRGYLVQLVTAHAGVSQQEAQARVDGVISAEQAAAQKARTAADAARKSASAASIFAALALLVGAFIASVAAAYGGGVRDGYRPGI